MEMVISENEKVIQSISKDMDLTDFIKALENFQYEANAKLTKIIQDLCGSVGFEFMEADSDSSEDDKEEDTSDIPKKKKR